MSEDNIINELNERQSRALNVMLYNLPESVPNENDIDVVRDIVRETINDNLRTVRTCRNGKENKNGSRDLKVVFSNAIEALKILKNRKTQKDFHGS
ncbi:hypothetical protein JTB14_013115 [Gonioctena quinquepunctata]|nr:hypothetical protein JTB14_013115 [Gonioctena quinquepunctata]